MNLLSRIEKLEAAAEPVGPDLDPELGRWNDVLATVLDLPGVSDDAADAVEEHLQSRFELLEFFAGGIRDEEERLHPDVLLDFARRLPEDLRGAVLSGGLTRNGWLSDWLLSLSRDESELPDLDQDVLRAIVRVYLGRSEDVDGFPSVCTVCRLRIPQHKSPPIKDWKLLPGEVWGEGSPPWYDLPRFFDACPHCHSKGSSS